MLSNHILQKTVDGISNITGEKIAVCAPEGTVLYSNFDLNAISISERRVKEFAISSAESQTASGLHFIKVKGDQTSSYIIVSESSDSAVTCAKIVAFQISELDSAYRDRLDKDNFAKNLLLDNMLLVDIYNRARKLHIEMEEKRVAILVSLPKEHDRNELGRIKDTFRPKNNEFVTTISENSIVIVACPESDATEEEVDKKAKVILDSFPEAMKKSVRISYGSIVNELKEVSRSYKEAIMAMEIGEIFFPERQVVAYSLLGIGRLIYQLPIPLCKMFIKEIFDDKKPDEFDEEMVVTINKFFENSLNVSETSRQLYIHRNTLVYRLDKLEKSTGLDLRVFEDAITFKIAMMVTKYMKYMEAGDDTF